VLNCRVARKHERDKQGEEQNRYGVCIRACTCTHTYARARVTCSYKRDHMGYAYVSGTNANPNHRLRDGRRRSTGTAAVMEFPRLLVSSFSQLPNASQNVGSAADLVSLT